MRRCRSALAVAGLAAAVSATAQPPAPATVPPEIAAALGQHLGKWRSEMSTVTNAGASPVGAATWECEAAVGGAGFMCTWLHEWPGGTTDRAIDLVGYDPASGKLIFTRVTDRGIASVNHVEVVGSTLVSAWEGTQDGKPLVGRNEVFMTPSDGADWTQRMTIDVDGNRVTELRIAHHRVQ